MSKHDFDQRAFRDALGNYPTGVAVIAARNEHGEVESLVVGTFSSVSLEPPLVSFMPRKESRTFRQLRDCGKFTVNVLAFDQAQTCAGIARRDTEFLAGLNWEIGDSGTVTLPGVLATIDCTFADVIEAGDHYIALGEVHGFTARRTAAPLVFFQGAYGGFASRDANTCDTRLAETVATVSGTQPELDSYAAALGAEVSVLARIEDDFFTVGIAAHGAPLERLGQRHPVLPPLGEFFVAWNESEQLRWLDQVRDPEVRHMLDERLARARERGWAVSLRNSYRNREILAALESYREPFLAPVLQREIEATIKQADKYYEDRELQAEETYPVESLVVPIRHPEGEVAYVLRANFNGAQLTGASIMHRINLMRTAAGNLNTGIYRLTPTAALV